MTDNAEGKHVETGGTVFGGRIGRVIELGGIDVNSREWAESSLGKASRRATEALLKKLLGKDLPIQGAVIAVLDRGDVIVSLGSVDGLRDGDVLEVVRPEETRNSKGSVVWSTERMLGAVRVVEAQQDRSRAAPVEKELRLAEGDVVRIRSDRRTPRPREAQNAGRD